MAGQRSRAYKLQLSSEGVQLFLRCHYRLCRVASDFLTYGTTLFVAVSIFERIDTDEAASLFLETEQAHLGGGIIQYVGTSPVLADIVGNIAEKMSASGSVHPAPRVWKIFNASLTHMDELNDQQLARAFHALAPGEI